MNYHTSQGCAEECTITLPVIGEVTIPKPGEAKELSISGFTITIDKEGNIKVPQFPAVSNLNIYDLGCDKIKDAVGTITVNNTNTITNTNVLANNTELLNLINLISSFGDFQNLDIAKIKELLEFIKNSNFDLTLLPEGTKTKLEEGIESYLRSSDAVTRAGACEAFQTLQVG